MIKDFSTLTLETNEKRPNQFLSNKIKDNEFKRKLKNKHFKQKEINDLYDHFEFLGYDLEKEYILSYVNLKAIGSENNPLTTKPLKIFNWITTTAGWYETNVYDIYLKKSFRVRKMCEIKDHILSHVYPLETKNPRVKNNIASPEYVKTLKQASNTVGSSIKENSNMLVLDIDCHDGNIVKTDEVVTKLKNYLKNYNCKPVLEEVCPEGGHHIYIKLDYIYTWEEKKSWLNNFNKENNTKFELPVRMRFPHSYQYETISETGEILTPTEARDYARRNRTSISIPKLESPPEINNIINLSIIKEGGKKNIASSLYKRKSKGSARRTDYNQFLNDRTLHLKNESKIIDLTAEYRHEGMCDIISAGKFSGWSIFEIFNAIKVCKNGSRDLANWSDSELLSIVTDMYNTCRQIPNGYSNEYKEIAFISNIYLIPNNIKETVLNNQILNTIISKSGLKISDRNKKDISIIFLEMLGSMYYNCINPKEVYEGKSLKYLKGMQYSIKYADRLKDHYPELKERDVFGIINNILKYSSVFKQFIYCDRGWKYSSVLPQNNSCRLFYLTMNINNTILVSMNKVSYFILNTLLNLIKNTITKNNYLLYQIFLNRIYDYIDELRIDEVYMTDVG